MTLAAFTAGQRVLASQLNKFVTLCNSALQNISYPETGSGYTLTTTETLVPGCTATITTTGASSIVEVKGVFDFQVVTSSSGNTMIGRCQLNGVAQPSGAPREAHLQDNGTQTRDTAAQNWTLAVPAGTYTVRLTALKSASGGTHMAAAIHTTMTLSVWDLS